MLKTTVMILIWILLIYNESLKRLWLCLHDKKHMSLVYKIRTNTYDGKRFCLLSGSQSQKRI